MAKCKDELLYSEAIVVAFQGLQPIKTSLQGKLQNCSFVIVVSLECLCKRNGLVNKTFIIYMYKYGII